MSVPDYAASPRPIRSDLEGAHQRAWSRIASPGSWWTGAERVAIAAATRDARQCALCDRKVAALSPSAVPEHHAAVAELPVSVVDLVHHIRRDAPRLTRSHVESLINEQFSYGHYVELIGVVATVVAVDSFARFMQLEAWPLPDPVHGEPDRYQPAGISHALAWVPVVNPEDVSGSESDLCRDQSGANIHRALTLVPSEKRGFFDLDDNRGGAVV